MPRKLKNGKRDYKNEYAQDHASSKQRADRSKRNQARRKMGLKKGDGKEVDHKRPLSKGGSNSRSNLKVTSRTANRKKGSR